MGTQPSIHEAIAVVQRHVEDAAPLPYELLARLVAIGDEARRQVAFVEALRLANATKPPATESDVDDRVDEWHDDPHSPDDIWQALGWTQDGYSSWVMTGQIPSSQ
jgi:hypothetical protein